MFNFFLNEFENCYYLEINKKKIFIEKFLSQKINKVIDLQKHNFHAIRNF